MAHRVVCPFLRRAADTVLMEPGDAPCEEHRCVAIAGPRVLSHQQQELVCLRSAHVDCPRYRRAIAPSTTTARHPIHAPAASRAVIAALVVLAISAAISLGFVAQRGGIDLPSGHAPASSTGVAAAATPGASAALRSPAPTGSIAATPRPTSGSKPTPAAASSGAPAASAAPRSSPTAAPSPRPTTSGVPSASRLAVLTPCSGRAGCYVYSVRSGDNLFSIAHWFGVSLPAVYALNPTVKRTGLRPGATLKIPTPTR